MAGGSMSNRTFDTGTEDIKTEVAEGVMTITLIVQSEEMLCQMRCSKG